MDIRNSTTLQGAKIALLCGSQVVAYQRDDFAHIPDPGAWDLPGGVREPHETALTCALRETTEEFGITVAESLVTYATTYWADNPRREVAFFVAEISADLIDRILFGDEGQGWRMMDTAEFTARPDAVPELRRCLTDYLSI